MRRSIVIVGLLLLAVLTGCSQTTQAVRESGNSGHDHKQQQINQENVNNSINWNNLQAAHDDDHKKKEKHASSKELKPTKVAIPKLGIKADTTDLGVLSNGQMAVPKKAQDVGWFKKGAKPGEKGRAVLAGHTDYNKQVGVFHDIDKLSKGNFVYITNKKGQRLKFKVYKKNTVSRKSQDAVKDAFGYSAAKTVALISCEGEFNEKEGTHEDRIIVYANLVHKK